MKNAQWFLGLALVLSSALAQADIPPPNTSECQGKALNDSCMTDNSVAGTCQNSTCSHTAVLADGGRGSVSSPCLVCTPASADAGTAADAGTFVDAGTTTTTTNSGNGCSTGSLVSSVGPLALAMLVPLFLRRRARRS